MKIVVYDTGYSNAAFNMAADEYALKHLFGSVFRFYGWHPYALSFGRFQRAAFIDSAQCADRGIDLVRRMTGGKAVLHKNDLSYSFALRNDDLPEKVEQSYTSITKALRYSLAKVGLDAEIFASGNDFSPETLMCSSTRMTGDVLVCGKKVAGSAQARHKKRVLHHGSINISCETEELAALLSPYPQTTTENGKSTSNLEKECKGKIDIELLKKSFIEGLAIEFRADIENSCLSPSEIEEIEGLYVPKYKSPEWTHRI